MFPELSEPQDITMSLRTRWTKVKIAILGSPGVGKTAFAVRYLTRRFIGEYDRNKEMLYKYKVTFDRDEINLEILDTATKGFDHATLEGHIRWADGFVLMYSVTDKASHARLRELYANVNSIRRHEDTPVVLVANKTDLTYARKVTEAEGVELGKELLCPMYEISIADSPDGVMEIMDEILKQVKREYMKTPVVGFEKKSGSAFNNVKRVLKKKIYRSRSDTT